MLLREAAAQAAANEPKVLYTPPSVKGVSTPDELALAQFLTKKGAKFYGAYWCPFCTKQRAMFGAAGVRALPYVECASDGYGAQRCPPQVTGFPAWEIDGQFYSGLKTLTQLQSLSGFDAGVVFPAPPPPPPPPAMPPGGFKQPAVTEPSTPEQVQLATHLKQSGALFYGAYWCKYCRLQRALFGAEGAAALPYVECAAGGFGAQKCPPEVDGFPTWKIGGKFYGGYQTVEELARLSKFKPAAAPKALAKGAGAVEGVVAPKAAGKKDDLGIDFATGAPVVRSGADCDLPSGDCN